MSAHRYWRVACYTVGGHQGSAWNVAAFELAQSNDGINECVSGTGTASSAFTGFAISKAFDNDPSTYWSSNGFGFYEYIQYDFGSGVTKDIVEVRTTDRNDTAPGYNMTSGELFYSDDGSTWTSAGKLGFPVTTTNKQISIYRPNAYSGSAHRYWRVTAVQTGPGNFGFSECEMAESAGGTNVCGSGTPSAATDDGVNHIAGGFDGNTSTMYGASGGLPKAFSYDFGSGVTKNIRELRLKSRTDGNYNQNIKQGYVEYSDDGSTWTLYAYIAAAQSTSNGETKTFDVTPMQAITPYSGPGAPSHRFWRILANSTGSGNFGFSEMAVAQVNGGTNIASSSLKYVATDDGVNHIAGGFDGNTATMYGAAGGLPRSVDLDFGYGGIYPHIEEVKITSRTDGYYHQNITAGKVQWSDDGITYTDYWSMSASAATVNGQVVTFQNGSPPLSRRRQPSCVCA